MPLVPLRALYAVAMPDPEEHIIDRAGKRVAGTFLGLVVGLIVGLIFGLVAALTMDFGSTTFFIGIVASLAITGGVVGYLSPRPFLVLAEILLSVFS